MLFVAVDCEVLHTIDEKVVAKALATLEDLNDLGLLDEGEPEILEAASEAYAQRRRADDKNNLSYRARRAVATLLSPWRR